MDGDAPVGAPDDRNGAGERDTVLGTLAVEAASERGVQTVGFTGGVAYNDAISRHLRDVVTDAEFTYLTPDAVPPGDGGIAYGQAIVAASRSNHPID